LSCEVFPISEAPQLPQKAYPASESYSSPQEGQTDLPVVFFEPHQAQKFPVLSFPQLVQIHVSFSAKETAAEHNRINANRITLILFIKNLRYDSGNQMIVSSAAVSGLIRFFCQKWSPETHPVQGSLRNRLCGIFKMTAGHSLI
jgi:hypothetical protein